MKAEVAVLKCDSYRKACEGVKKVFELLGGIEEIEKNTTVLVKPNVLSPLPPERAVTSHPEVVRGVIRVVKNRTEEIILGDSPGMAGYGITRNVLEISGMSRVAREEKIKLSVFESSPLKKKIAGIDFHLSSDAVLAEHLISVPKLKTHSMATITGAVKNLFGLLVGAEKQKAHRIFPSAEDFSVFISDLLRNFYPSFSIMDGIVGKEMEGVRGKLHRVGILLGSRDPVALDSVASAIIGLQPEKIPLLRRCSALGLGISELEKIEVIGEEMDRVSHRFEHPPSYLPSISSIFLRIAERFARPRPFLSGKCEGCGTCSEKCPVGAIRLDKIPVFDYRRCIRCYCCKELCPNGAIDVWVHPFHRIGLMLDSGVHRL
jgi:uncharacterized protein (DUF362 family)/NAD-dependent dihydropyrimidine dehydrogenase PreA subunit